MRKSPNPQATPPPTPETPTPHPPPPTPPRTDQPPTGTHHGPAPDAHPQAAPATHRPAGTAPAPVRTAEGRDFRSGSDAGSPLTPEQAQLVTPSHQLDPRPNTQPPRQPINPSPRSRRRNPQRNPDPGVRTAGREKPQQLDIPRAQRKRVLAGPNGSRLPGALLWRLGGSCGGSGEDAELACVGGDSGELCGCWEGSADAFFGGGVDHGVLRSSHHLEAVTVMSRPPGPCGCPGVSAPAAVGALGGAAAWGAVEGLVAAAEAVGAGVVHARAPVGEWPL